MKRIGLIMLHFGKWPPWMHFLLKTCAYNPTVNWLLFTDCHKIADMPANVNYFKMTVDEFKTLFWNKIGLKINTPVYPRMCDYRPAYGIVFEDYLQGFDFWGYCNLDVVWGDIRKFLSEDILDKYDIISARKEYLVSHFTLFKNCKRINRVYKKSRDYKIIFNNSRRFFNFEECSFRFSHLLQGGSIFDKYPLIRKLPHFIKHSIIIAIWRLGLGHSYISVILDSGVESLTECVMRLEKQGYLKVLFKNMVKEYGIDLNARGGWHLLWDKGRLLHLDKKEEFLYFHFLDLKREKQFMIPETGDLSDIFSITKTGFNINKDNLSLRH